MGRSKRFVTETAKYAIREYALGTYYFLHIEAEALDNEVKGWRAISYSCENYHTTIFLI